MCISTSSETRDHDLFCSVKKNRQVGVVVITLVICLSVLYLVKKGQSGGDTPTVQSPDQVDTTTTTKEPIPEPAPEITQDVPVDSDKKPVESKAAEGGYSFAPSPLKYTSYYTPPLDGTLLLSGTFGELRGNHFHAGLDIRTGGVEGKKVKAVAQGFVTRIKVSTRGYGKAIYIRHPNGTTSVYGHLQRFDGKIQEAVIAHQYQQERYEFDWYVPTGKLKVTQGQVIALSGNTGGSGGPHLHFEIRNSQGRTVNPLLYGIEVPDRMEPRVLDCLLFEIDNDRYAAYGTYASKQIIREGEMKVAPGTYGIGARWIDYFTDKHNSLGINYAQVEVDGKVRFTHRIEDFAFDQGRYINAHIDYWRYKNEYQRFVKLFKDRGNALHFYKGSGTMKLADGDQHRIKIRIRDFSGKTDVFGFRVVCKKGEKALSQGGTLKPGSTRCTPRGGAVLRSENGVVNIPRGAVYRTTYMGLTETPPTGKAISPMIRVNHSSVPLHKSATIKIRIPEEYRSYGRKVVMLSYDKKQRSSSFEGGKKNGNYVVETSKSLGMFYLALDTVPPKVTPLTLKRYLSFRAQDLTSDIGSYECTIGGKWVLLEHEPKASKLFGTIPQKIGSGKHELVLTVYDSAGNKTEVKRTIQIQ